MSRLPPAALAATLLLTASCLDVSGADFTSVDFLLTTGGRATGWIVGVADVPAARVDEVGVIGTGGTLPAELATTDSAIYQSGTNVSGDLFVFQKKYWFGFRASATFKVTIQLAYVTNYQADCTNGPGPAVVIKAGLSDIEPMATPDAQGVLRMNIDKGAGVAKGQFTQLGDIRNSLSGCSAPGSFAARATVEATQTATVTTDAQGGFWMFLGTQSSLSGARHEIYFTDVLVKFR